MAHGRREWPIDEGYAAVEECEAPYNFWDFPPRMGSHRLNRDIQPGRHLANQTRFAATGGAGQVQGISWDASSQQSTSCKLDLRKM